jgi:hypothetical protein
VSLSCKTCGAPLEEAQLDRVRGLGRCRYCDTVVELDFTRPEPRVKAPYVREPVAMPARFEWTSDQGILTVCWQWASLEAASWALFTIMWFAVLFVHVESLLHEGASGSQLLQPAGLLLLGLAIGYVAACKVLNTTTIKASSEALHIRHAPLPWPGGGTVQGVRQLFTKERALRGGHGRRSYSYELHAILAGGKRRRLVARLEEASQALWLEQTLEEHLQLTDRPVGGEIPRA